MAWLIGALGSLGLYVLGVDVSTAFMSLSHNVTASKLFKFVLCCYIRVNTLKAVFQCIV